MFRVGIGYDVHAFEEDRPLIMGGIRIPHSHGLAGNSDADVLIHAICDALLGALSLGDIGRHFPDNDPSFKNIQSTVLLQESYRLVEQERYSLVNLDSVVILQKPKIATYIPEMCSNLSKILWCKPEQISVKATTTEHLGFTGREEGVAASAIVLLAREKGK